MATTTASPETKKSLALAIIDFLNTSLTDGTLAPDDKESIEVATSCISDAFKVDPASTSAATPPGQNLLSIYSVYEKLRGKSTPSTQGDSSAKEGRPATPQTAGASASSADKNPEAEALKAKGNAAMQTKDYMTAINHYSSAIAISPTNAIYLSNRAAAYSATGKHEEARNDAELATASDPKYTKAWSRLGLARFALGDAQGSMEAYQRGIEAEGNGGSEVMKKGYETAKRKVEEDEINAEEEAARSTSPTGGAGAGGMPDLASMLGGMGGGGGGGMPDFSQMMNNPMFKQMADRVMQNPDMLNSIMNNPQMRQMAEQFGGGGGSGAGGAGAGAGAGAGGGGGPDFSQLMNDPNIAEMARNLMGGGGAGGAGAGAGAGRGRGA